MAQRPPLTYLCLLTLGLLQVRAASLSPTLCGLGAGQRGPGLPPVGASTLPKVRVCFIPTAFQGDGSILPIFTQLIRLGMNPDLCAFLSVLFPRSTKESKGELLTVELASFYLHNNPMR